jgi:hypothetical protein
MNEPIKNNKQTDKPARIAGRLPTITTKDAEKVASFEAEGLPITKALRLVNKRFSLAHWHESLARDSDLLRDYETKAGELQLEMLRTIKGTDRSKLPVGTCWILERRFGADYAQPKAGGGQNITFNAPTQINVNVIKAARSLLRRVTLPPTPDERDGFKELE